MYGTSDSPVLRHLGTEKVSQVVVGASPPVLTYAMQYLLEGEAFQN